MPEMGDKEGEMPKDKFYVTGQVFGDDKNPEFTVAWGTTEKPQVLLNNVQIATPDDVSGLDRMIQVLQRARRAMLGTTTGVDLAVDSFLAENPATPPE
jgi:hypothetical protein